MGDMIITPPQGQWRARCIAGIDAVNTGYVDKPCWEVQGPEGVKGFVWTWGPQTERRVIGLFILELWPNAFIQTRKTYHT